MLRTRLVTAAVALPSLWLIVWKLPDALFAGFIMAVAVMGRLMFPLLHADDLPGAMHRLGLSLLGVLYVGFFTPHFVLLHAQGWRWVLFTVYAAMGSDSGGYFAGRAFGRHPLAPAISPSKTVEGALGALAGAM